MIWTTDLPTSQRIKELIGEQEAYLYHLTDSSGIIRYSEPLTMEHLKEEGWYESDDEDIELYPAFTLSELAPVLKKIHDDNDWGKFRPEETIGEAMARNWMTVYLKVCELVGTGQEEEANQYLLELLK